ncbi:hypothetical protein F5Y07DRAFT_266650 [Xylaria sp. FL0933]|nr:hypothetical protein F5Y07DRAFT_266650 [Xylaria sp. FL0933]
MSSDPAPANPEVPSPPPASSPEEDRRSSKTASPLLDHGASGSTMASVGSSSCPHPPSLPSSTSKAPPSVSGSRTTATSPPTTVSHGPGPAPLHAAGPRPAGASIATMSLNPDLPSHDSQLHVAEARAALVASMSNMLDSELQSRASLLHANAAVLSRQEQDVAKATEALRKENDKLAKVAKDAGRKIKELGNVQNWAEVLERDFLVLEETMRLVRDGGAESSDDGTSGSDYSGSSWSGSESEREGDGERDGAKLGSQEARHEDRLGELHERNRDKEEKGAAPSKKEKGKELDGSGDSSAVGRESTPSDMWNAGSASNLLSCTNATVALDEAILESLTEALATDLHIGHTSTKQNTT